MALTLDNIIAGILDRLNATSNEFWLNVNFQLYAGDFQRRDDVREACWLQKLDSSQVTVGNKNDYNLPADYWRTENVWWTVTGQDFLLDPGALGETGIRTKWSLWGGKLMLSPAPQLDQAGYTIKHYYVRPPVPTTSTGAALDIPDSLGEALQAYLMGRAMEKGGPEMAGGAAQYQAEAQGRIVEAMTARKKSLGAPGFQQRVRW